MGVSLGKSGRLVFKKIPAMKEQLNFNSSPIERSMIFLRRRSAKT
jgi:hypothetical protein